MKSSNNIVTPLKVGAVFDRLTIKKQIGVIQYGTRRRTAYLCSCTCGAETTVVHWYLKTGRVRSCGCLVSEIQRERAIKRNTTHGMRFSIEHRSWAHMLYRCRNKKHHAYKDYGGRGISVCKRWYKFENFYTDMGPRISTAMSIDRIDVNGNYNKKNCRWATRLEQQRNRRDNAYKNVGASATVPGAGK